ncbi:MAG TPA: hypothetical protein VFF11_15340 [Candidatus Binatia bacterium]|nr:hypothetical protein [Candidatus Binatia bacterium]
MSLLLVVAGLLWLPLTVSAAISAAKTADPNPQARKLAETVSLITGVAISPLMGVSAVGAYEYLRAKPEEKASLPWFANPWFWGPALLLVGACFLKDTAGIAIPTVLKKPFDMAEAVEHKISGIVATGAFVPIAASIFHSPGQPSASLAEAGLATIDLHWLYNILTVPVAMAAFFIVFLASNAINMLILLSPFSTVDAALKAFRTMILASVVGTSFVNPWMGAAWALVIILFSWLIAGWSFRLSHFGLSFLWDFFTGRRNRFHPDARENKMFLGARIQKVPTRTYGKLSKNEKGELVFNYRPWLVLPPRSLVLPAGNYEAGRGIFYSEILRVEGESVKTMILLPPRYRGHEEEVANIYNFSGTRDVGIRAAWAWFKSLFGGKRVAA